MVDVTRGVIVAIVTVLFSFAISIYPGGYSVLIFGSLSLLTYLLLEWIAFKSPLTVIFRKRLYPYSDLEGFWLQRVGKESPEWERPWSVSHIRPKGYSRGWIYEGTAYDRDCSARATWSSFDICFDPLSQFWVFKGRSKRLDGVNVTKEGNVLSVLYWGEHQGVKDIDLRAKFPGRLTDLDYEDKPFATSIQFYRINEADWSKAGITTRQTRLQPSTVKALVELVTKEESNV